MNDVHVPELVTLHVSSTVANLTLPKVKELILCLGTQHGVEMMAKLLRYLNLAAKCKVEIASSQNAVTFGHFLLGIGLHDQLSKTTHLGLEVDLVSQSRSFTFENGYTYRFTHGGGRPYLDPRPSRFSVGNFLAQVGTSWKFQHLTYLSINIRDYGLTVHQSDADETHWAKLYLRLPTITKLALRFDDDNGWRKHHLVTGLAWPDTLMSTLKPGQPVPKVLRNLEDLHLVNLPDWTPAGVTQVVKKVDEVLRRRNGQGAALLKTLKVSADIFSKNAAGNEKYRAAHDTIEGWTVLAQNLALEPYRFWDGY
jgi:hypothetical protein